MVMSDTSKLLELMADLRSQRTQIERQFRERLEKLDQDIASVQRTLQLLGEGHAGQVSARQLDLNTVNMEAIVQAKSQYEAMKVIARFSGGRMNITEAADILIRAGRAKGKRRNLVASLYSQAKDHEEDWKWVAKGTFQLAS